MIWVYFTIGIVTILFFPIRATILLYYDGEDNRLYLSVYAYGFIKVIGGYSERNGLNYIFHYSNKKAKAINRSDMGNLNIKLKDLKAFEVLSSRLTFSFPFEVKYLNYGMTVTNASNLIFPIFKDKKDFIDLKSTIVLGRDEHMKVYYKLEILFNIFVLLGALFKIRVINEK